MMTKRQYLTVCMAQDLDWLRNCDAHPSIGQTATHRALVKIAIRRKTGGKPKAALPVMVWAITEYGLTQKLSAGITCF
jgi:hypothetical protein